MNQPLAEAIFLIAALACIVAEIAILRSLFVARRIEKSDLVPSAPRGGEVAWAIIPALALSCLLVVTWEKIEAREDHMRMMHHSGMPEHLPMPGTTRPPSRR